MKYFVLIANIWDALILYKHYVQILRPRSLNSRRRNVIKFVSYWLWWHERNKVDNGDTMRTIPEISSSIEYHLLNFMLARSQRNESNKKME